MTREQFIRQVELVQEAFRCFLLALCCGDSSLADDIAQESFVKAYLSIDGFSNVEKFRFWIFRIGYNTFVNSRRSRKIFCAYDEAQNVVSDETADSAFRYEALYTSLNRLTENERTAILLFYMQNCSIKEIAGIMEVTPDAVKQYLSRGRRHLRALIDTEQ